MKKLILLFVLLLFPYLDVQAEPIIADHTASSEFTKIPLEWIEQAKQVLHIGYGHTSHGSQITDGMTGLVSFANNGGLGLNLPENTFSFNHGGTNGALDLCENSNHLGAYDLGNPDRTTWATATRNFLDNVHPYTNVIMWSWCGQADTTEENINLYLSLMDGLEKDYPDVKFVYMTGHLVGTGPQGNLNLRNEQIREYCRKNDKILYDFADIESYDPDGQVNYMELNANDACDYDSDGNGSRDRNWAIDWQNSHTEGVDWYTCGSAHSQPLNANQKAYAVWWLWARLAGWDGIVQTNTASDINKDGNVNIQDVQACVNHISGTQDWGSAADVNGDGRVDEADVDEIIEIIVGK